MTAKNNPIVWLPALLVLLSLTASAQHFKTRASLGAVPATGFYRIPVTPEITGVAKSDLSDLRIVDDSNVHVPYINQNELNLPKPDAFEPLTIISNDPEGKFTTVVVENNITSGITSLSLVMSNTAVERHTAVSGSDDRSKWYIIDDSILFRRAYRDMEGRYIQTISFPLSKYKYFKLKVDNANTDPVRILSAGVYKSTSAPGMPTFIDNPTPGFTQKDSGHVSYVTITNPMPWLVKRISLDVSGPKFYNRTAAIYLMHDTRDSISLREPISSCTLSSDRPCTFDLGEQKAQTIILEIDNKDNQPIKIVHAATSQMQQYLVAWLEKGKTYSLLANDPLASAPQYDLSHFKKDIPATLPELTLGAVSDIHETPATAAAKPSGNYWLWPTIILSVCVLSLLTYRLLKDVKQQQR